jgi:hypothetical protein
MLAAERPGQAASQPSKNSDFDRNIGSLLPRTLRPLHREISRAGRSPSVMGQIAEVGIHGNGHAMMIEKNDTEIASVLSQWLAKTISGKGDR